MLLLCQLLISFFSEFFIILILSVITLSNSDFFIYLKNVYYFLSFFYFIKIKLKILLNMIQFSKNFLFNYKSFHIYITVCFPIYYQVLRFYKITEKERSLPYTCFHGFLFECHCQKNFRKVHHVSFCS